MEKFFVTRGPEGSGSWGETPELHLSHLYSQPGGGYLWRVLTPGDEDLGTEDEIQTLWTDESFSGLWCYAGDDPGSEGGRQVVGTGQFRLSSDPRAARRQLVREFLRSLRP